jgi:hypothetical protein
MPRWKFYGAKKKPLLAAPWTGQSASSYGAFIRVLAPEMVWISVPLDE